MSDPSWALMNAEESERTTVNNPPVSGNAASDELRQRIGESLDNYPVACWTTRNLAARVTGVVGGDLDRWEEAAREASDRLTRVRKAVASFDGCGVIAVGHVNFDIPTAGEVLDKIREALEGPTGNGTAGFVPATPKHFADMPRSDADPLVIEPYRNDQNQPRWAFRCWGTDACDGWLSLELSSERWAEVVRERHIAEAHPEMAATEATRDTGPSVRECAAADRAWDAEREGE